MALPSASVLRHIVDAHCHPTDAPEGISDASMAQLDITICAMASVESDQSKVRDLALRFPDKVVPCFGYHPWVSHLISTTPSTSATTNEAHYRTLFLPTADQETQFQTLLATLPTPRPLPTILTELRSNLLAFPNAMLGEVGLDRAFRVPVDFFASPRVLTPFHIPLAHQLAVLEAQMDVAVELGRNVSVHSVKAQQATIDLLAGMRTRYGERWSKISVDMHSCGFSAQSWRDVEKKHENVFLSLSTVINSSHGNYRSLIAACSPDRLLVESDYNNIDMCTRQTWDMVKIIAEIRGWHIESKEWVGDANSEPEETWGVVRRLEKNWRRFRDGGHVVRQTRKEKKKRVEYYSDSEGPDAEQGEVVDINKSS
ncbi:Metallo-dependent hydrolase [Pholiota conissans]|uniref:Metallo-dependent hydrolase n=1 Tax=Pholiota conissans TaxID=109636 RepID=A0A9P6D7F2_9AGAR|nr:Metallo-dependent hydrolase [Pholiota conissans]